MRYISEYSRRGLVNILAEKISQKLSENEKYSAIIEVVDCMNFMVIKGFTTNSNILNLVQFKDEFMKEESDFIEKIGLKRFNLIDVIDYKQSIVVDDAIYWFDFWNSKRPLYNESIIDMIENGKIAENTFESISYSYEPEVEFLFPLMYNDIPIKNNMSPLTISSEFPFGYSFRNGKTKLMYCEYICNQLFSVLNTDRILFKMSSIIDEHGDWGIEIKTNSQYSDSDVKSMVLDIFDFDLTKFETNYLKKYDFLDEIRKPLELKPWLNKDKVRELMIV